MRDERTLKDVCGEATITGDDRDVIQLTLILKMTTTPVVETSVTINNSPTQDYAHTDDYTQPTYEKFKLISKIVNLKPDTTRCKMHPNEMILTFITVHSSKVPITFTHISPR